MSMLNKCLVITTTLLLTCHFIQAQRDVISEKKPFAIGDIITMHSAILGEDREINVYLPYGYSPDSMKTYPVIYLLDGSIDEDIIHIAGLVQFGAFPWINMNPEMLVVGISNVDRERDFTFPTRNEKDKQAFPTTGGSAKFIDFIRSELKPLINRSYHTSSHDILIGQSLGGLIASEILLKSPDLFDDYIIISPSLWWDDESLLTSEPAQYVDAKSIYVGVGSEGKVMEGDAMRLYLKIQDAAPEGAHVHFKHFDTLTHADILHLAVYDSFEKMYRKSED